MGFIYIVVFRITVFNAEIICFVISIVEGKKNIHKTFVYDGIKLKKGLSIFINGLTKIFKFLIMKMFSRLPSGLDILLHSSMLPVAKDLDTYYKSQSCLYLSGDVAYI